MRTLRAALVLAVVFGLGLSFALIPEDLAETVFDESETLPYEATPLFSIVPPQVAGREVTFVLGTARLGSDTSSALPSALINCKDLIQLPNARGGLALLSTLRC